LGIDQSALLLGSGNDIQSAAVFEELKKFDKIKQKNVDRFSILHFADDDYIDIDDDNLMNHFEFDESNSFFITSKVFEEKTNDRKQNPIKNYFLSIILQFTENQTTISSDGEGRCQRKTLFESKTVCCPYKDDEGVIISLRGGDVAREGIMGVNVFEQRVAYSAPPERIGSGLIVGGRDRIQTTSMSRSYNQNANYGGLSLMSGRNHFQSTTQMASTPFETPYGNPREFQSIEVPITPKFEIRKSFPETWFFDDFVMDEK